MFGGGLGVGWRHGGFFFLCKVSEIRIKMRLIQFLYFLSFRGYFSRLEIRTVNELTICLKASNGQWFLALLALLFSVFIGGSKAAAPIGDKVL